VVAALCASGLAVCGAVVAANAPPPPFVGATVGGTDVGGSVVVGAGVVVVGAGVVVVGAGVVVVGAGVVVVGAGDVVVGAGVVVAGVVAPLNGSATANEMVVPA